ncbi:hypothetical protein BDW62DRAFT_196612 [Aspergillus aurantiobrunneus]
MELAGWDGSWPNPAQGCTICAPQLLHLDRHGRPLWFNGWLLPNKYKQDKHEPSNFEAFLREPHQLQEPAAWQLRESNICCLTAEQKGEFTFDERELLDMTIAKGRQVGALGRPQ